MPGKTWLKSSRKLHRVFSLWSALPLLIIILTGVLLILRGQFDWIQPPAQNGIQAQVSPQISPGEILLKLQSHPELRVRNWTEVSSVIFKPSKGIYQVRLKNNYEVQYDAQNGRLLHTQYRTTSLLISLHQGSFFGNWVMLWVFFPSGVLLLGLWLSGFLLYVLPLRKKRKKRNQKEAHI